MRRNTDPDRFHRAATILVSLVAMLAGAEAVRGDTPDGWIALFDGRSLDGWRAAENPDAWSVRDGCLVARGKRSHLFYTGSVGAHDFSNFELEIEAMTAAGADSGVFFHTEYQARRRPTSGYEVQIRNGDRGGGARRNPIRTGSLVGVRNIAKSFVKDGKWFRMKLRVVGPRVRIHVDGNLVVDYISTNRPGEADRRRPHGTIALQAHDAKSAVRFRRVRVRLLANDADSRQPPRFPTSGYGVTDARMDEIAKSRLPFIDFHVHLRGGMTVEKAMARQAATGINVGVLRNIGEGWPIETDAQLRAFLDATADRPVFVGLQVNDRDWHEKHARELLARLDFVLGDTMIMPMPTDDSPPVKRWESNGYEIPNAEAWMERYVRHNLRVLAEPITILANPTYLPPAVSDRYDELWTDARMERIIRAAIANGVALEINARSGNPSDRFIRLAKKLGAKFSFGTNNFHDRPIAMTRCSKAIDEFGLAERDMYVPNPKP